VEREAPARKRMGTFLPYDVLVEGPAAPIRVLVADDHLVMRLGLETLINAEDDMRVIAEAADGQQVIDLYREHRPDVVVVDLRMPGVDGVSAIRAICAHDPHARIIVLTVHKGDEAVYQALHAGARGYLLKDAPSEDIVNAVRAVHAGRRFLPPEVADQMAARIHYEALSEREIAVLKLMAKGLSNKDIGERLGTSEGTAKNHVANILAKLGVVDRTQAAMLALERNIIHLEDVDVRDRERPKG
jgi:two-component system NarL family response regulator